MIPVVRYWSSPSCVVEPEKGGLYIQEMEAKAASGDLKQPAGWTIRPATTGDIPFLEQMLYEAAAWDAGRERRLFREVLDHPRSTRYIKGWGHPGDSGLVAESAGGKPIGAAWYGLFPSSEPAYGYVSSAVPEITLAVVPEYRGQGVGSALLAALVRLARDSAIDSVSLSVEQSNPAARLYERQGFRKTGTSGASWTMSLNLVEGKR
jgi:[ribosomal protein S18]-alanine N-acetyltransferase